jgi:hypothetical protein
MKNFTSVILTLQRENGTYFRLRPEDAVPVVEYREVLERGTLNGVVVYARSGKRVNFKDIVFDKKDAPFIVTKEVFDALPCTAIDFVTPDVKYYGSLQDDVITRLISKHDVEVIPFLDHQQ